ncbi:hypothetical protein BH11PLA2_BH11PLA2_25680 [soil metagenome]
MRGVYALRLALFLLLSPLAAAQTPSSPTQLLTGVADLPASPSPASPPVTPLESKWADHLRFQSPDNGFSIHVGGNAQIDSTWLIGPNSAFVKPGGGTNGIGNASAMFLRRVRLRFDGSIYQQFDYVVEYDLANASNENNGEQPASFNNINGSPVPTNVWMQIRDVPYLGSVRFGNQTKPIGFTTQVSQANLPFMERADNHDAFYGQFDNGNAMGITSRNHTPDELITWQTGVYFALANSLAIGLNKSEWGGRITALPVFEDDGERLIHVGFGTLNGELPQNELRLRARTLLRNGPGFAVPVLADTGTIGGSRQYTLAPEFAAVYGSWTWQAEWAGQFISQATLRGGVNQGTAFFHGGYAQGLYFLTGETQSYDKEAGAFGRVYPNSNFRCSRSEGVTGTGAWQIGARIGYLNLNDGAIQGGRLYDFTLGLNWFLNPNMKFQFNYILERRDQAGVTSPSWINGLGIRGGYDF